VAETRSQQLKPLDAFLPSYEFAARYGVTVEADAGEAERAVREVTFREVPVVRALLFLRGLGSGRADERVLAAMGRRGRVLDDVPGEGVVLGVRGQFWRLRGRGNEPEATAVVDFRVQGDALTTETRVHVPPGVSRRRFARYWRIVAPFSGITRKQVLRAAKRRAERAERAA
jgi:membrane protein implicated in regulation of membrane protease activity